MASNYMRHYKYLYQYSIKLLRIGTNSGLFWTRWWSFGYKRRNVYWL